jgi:hypothetical protein
MSTQARVAILVVVASGLGTVLALRREPPRLVDIAVALVVAAVATLGMQFAKKWAQARGVNQAAFQALLFVGVVTTLVVIVEGFILVTKRYGLPAGW